MSIKKMKSPDESHLHLIVEDIFKLKSWFHLGFDLLVEELDDMVSLLTVNLLAIYTLKSQSLC